MCLVSACPPGGALSRGEPVVKRVAKRIWKEGAHTRQLCSACVSASQFLRLGTEMKSSHRGSGRVSSLGLSLWSLSSSWELL